MKINLEINLDWIDEEKGLDETVKEEVITGVVNTLQEKIGTKIEDKVNQIIDNLIVNKINEKTENLFEEFINRPVTLTDSYGSKVKVYQKMEDLIKERFDNFMEQNVDGDGRTSNSSYGTKHKRIDYIVHKQMREFADKFTKDAVETVSKEIKNHVQSGLTQKLGAELMNVLKVNEMLQLKS